MVIISQLVLDRGIYYVQTHVLGLGINALGKPSVDRVIHALCTHSVNLVINELCTHSVDRDTYALWLILDGDIYALCTHSVDRDTYALWLTLDGDGPRCSSVLSQSLLTGGGNAVLTVCVLTSPVQCAEREP